MVMKNAAPTIARVSQRRSEAGVIGLLGSLRSVNDYQAERISPSSEGTKSARIGHGHARLAALCLLTG
jgi:hypothetical protein